MIEINVNGKTEEVNRVSIKEYLATKGIVESYEGVVILVNEKIVKEDEFESYIVQNNDVIEILNFVSGG